MSGKNLKSGLHLGLELSALFSTVYNSSVIRLCIIIIIIIIMKLLKNTGMRHITTFRPTKDRIYDSGPIRL